MEMLVQGMTANSIPLLRLEEVLTFGVNLFDLLQGFLRRVRDNQISCSRIRLGMLFDGNNPLPILSTVFILRSSDPDKAILDVGILQGRQFTNTKSSLKR